MEKRRRRRERIKADFFGIAAVIRAVLYGIAAIVAALQAQPLAAHLLKVFR